MDRKKRVFRLMVVYVVMLIGMNIIRSELGIAEIKIPNADMWTYIFGTYIVIGCLYSLFNHFILWIMFDCFYPICDILYILIWPRQIYVICFSSRYKGDRIDEEGEDEHE